MQDHNVIKSVLSGKKKKKTENIMMLGEYICVHICVCVCVYMCVYIYIVAIE